MRYVAGINGGQSATAAVIIDETGQILGRGIGGAADHVGEPAGSTRCADACAISVSSALRAASLSVATPLEAVVAGISGYDAAFDGVAPRLRSRRFRFEHDAPVALAGAVAERPALLLISGTGSVVYGDDGVGKRVRVGGWGHLFGDEGSAFAIARDALASAMLREDRGLPSPLGTTALTFFRQKTLRGVGSAALLGRIARADLASFAPLVHAAAGANDPDGLRIIAEAADSLAVLAAIGIERLGVQGEPVPIALSGGSFKDARFFALVEERLRKHAPHARSTRPQYDPAVGAALLAFEDAGMPRPAAISG
jgi:N-acetylglucosamine kinase-like BadF-type ATPase